MLDGEFNSDASNQSIHPSGREWPFYTTNGLQKELCQGEIVSHLAQYTYNPVTNRATEAYHEYAIILSQDCDLAQDYASSDDKKELNGILVYELRFASVFFEENKLNSKDKQRIRLNREDRFHFLEVCPKEVDLLSVGIDELVIDFKKYFTIQPYEIYRQCESAHGIRRRARIETPFKEHLQSRLSFYLQRVSLPERERKTDHVVSNDHPVELIQVAAQQLEK